MPPSAFAPFGKAERAARGCEPGGRATRGAGSVGTGRGSVSGWTTPHSTGWRGCWGAARRGATRRALIAAALVGGAADGPLAKGRKKDRDEDRKPGNDRDGSSDKDKDRPNGRGGQASAEATKKNKNKNKQKRKRKKKSNNTGSNTGGNRCAGTPLHPGQDFVDCDFSDANLRGENLEGSLFKNVDLTDADLCGADLESASFADTKLIDANLTDVNLDSSSHSKGDFSGANLTNTTFRVATFSKVDFSGADLTGADFTGASFADTGFAGAILCRTIQPNGDVDNSDCDICDNTCGLCEACDDEDCTPPDCCPNPEGPGGTCVDTDTDPLNCGGCDAACFTNLSNACVDGECVCGNEPECSGGETCCRGEGGGATRCVDTDTDPVHCGACNEACLIPLNPCLSVECQDGQCVQVGAADGTPCQLEGESGVCCAAGSSVTCVVGTECCSNAQCGSGEACCEGQCIDVQDDPTNCGACDVICLTPTNPCLTIECIDGACVDGTLSNGTECEAFDQTGVCCASGGTSTCDFGAECCSDAQCGPGESCCGGDCLNTETDFDRCGSCTNQCPPSKADVCVGGECVCGNSGSACGSSLTCCEGACTDTDDDVLHCGSCDVACEIPLNPCLVVECHDGLCVEVPVENGFACAVGEQGGICCSSSGTSTCVVDALCCTDSQCTATEACCDNQCIDVRDDPDNCGACNVTCPTPTEPCLVAQCINGGCLDVFALDGEPCSEGAESGICCFDVETSICVVDATCCTDEGCLEGASCCNNTCVDTDNDRDNCGSCEVTCLSDATCIAGECELCEGVVCGNECLPAGPEVCCTGGDCERKPCQNIVGCSAEHVCQYENEVDGTPCGFVEEGDECVAGQCIPGGEL